MTTTRSPLLPLLLAAAAIAGGAVVAWRCGWLGGGQEAPPVAPAGPAAPAVGPEKPKEGPAPAQVKVEVRTPEQAGVPLEDCLKFPDGTYLPPLNGVKKAPPITFHRTQPYTKVVGITVDGRGMQWYLHENGVMSTTLPQPNGGAVTQVIMSTAPVPMVDDK